MSGEIGPGKDPVVACFDDLCDSILSADRESTVFNGGELVGVLQQLGPEGGEVAVDLALELIEGWMEAGEQADEGDGQHEQVRALIIEALVQLGDAFPHPVFAGAFEQSGRELLEHAPQLAADQLRRAVALADNDEERAGYLLSLVLALDAMDDHAAALALAEEAALLATEDETRDRADAFVIELLCDAGSPEAVRRAFIALARRGGAATEDLGTAMMRALLMEATRFEELDVPPTREVVDGLRIGLGRPDWILEPLTPSDFATTVAWLEFSRDDLTRLESTMAAAPGPFSHADFAAQAALLRVMVAFTHVDVLAMEDALRAAAPLVAESADPGLVTSYRGLSSLLSDARSGRSSVDVVGELGALRSFRGRATNEEFALFQDCLQAVKGVISGGPDEFPGSVLERLDAWCARLDHTDSDGMSVATIWAMGVVAATFAGHYHLAEERLVQFEAARSRFAQDSAQGRWLDLFVNSVAPALNNRGDPGRAASASRAIGAEYRRYEYGLGAFLADAQLAIIQMERDPGEALAAAARALEFRRKHRAVLSGSSERIALQEYLQQLVFCALKAAARLGDPRLMAELLEFLRAQEMPIVSKSMDASSLPMSMLLPPAAFADRREPGASSLATVDAVALPHARPVRMPWGSIALASFVAPDASASPVDLVIPVLRHG